MVIQAAQTYFTSFLHPFKFPLFVYNRDKLRKELVTEWEYEEIAPLEFWQAVSFSWICQIVMIAMSISYLYIGRSLTDISPYLEVSVAVRSFVILYAIQAITYPIKAYISLAIWRFTINIFGGIYLDETEIKERVEQVYTMSLSSSIWSLVPFIGPVLEGTIWHLYIFGAMKNTYNLGAKQVLHIFSLALIFYLLFPLASFLGIYAFLLI